jgi:hypothetical protein
MENEQKESESQKTKEIKSVSRSLSDASGE